MNPLKLAIVTTHPIQYYAPIFRALAADPRLQVRVYYTWSQAADGHFSDTFGREVAWDVPLLDGYDYEFTDNVARRPGTERFFGLRTPGLVPAVEAWGAEAVLVFGWNSAAHLGAMRHFKGRIPVFFRGDSVLLDPLPWQRALVRRAVLRLVYTRIDVALAVGLNNADYFRWAGVDPRRISIVPHSVDVARFSDPDGSQAARARAWRAELGIGDSDVALVFAGKLTDKKDPLLLVRAWRRSGVDAHLVVAGSGPLLPALEAEGAGDPRLHLISFQNQAAMPAVYRLGDVFVMPSKGPGETWGLALNEAMASARPVIASDRVGGARDLVRVGSNGWVFAAGDEAALAEVLRIATGRGRDGLAAMGTGAQSESLAWSSEATAARLAGSVLGHARPSASA
jgi:glycosyltransferase involved in cell wall biosynthesis